MKSFSNILITGTALALLACNSSTERQQNESALLQLDSNSLNDIQQNETEVEQNNNIECVRGKAEPIIQKEDYPNSTFLILPDSLSGLETVIFDNDDKLFIRNWGCDYYALTFRFETTKFQQDTTNLEYWFNAGKKLMTGMISAIDAPIDIYRGLVFLDSYILRDQKNEFKNLKLGEEIEFDGSELRSFVSVDRIEKMSDNKFAITISFVTGPL